MGTMSAEIIGDTIDDTHGVDYEYCIVQSNLGLSGNPYINYFYS